MSTTSRASWLNLRRIGLLGLLLVVVSACADVKQSTLDPQGESADSIQSLTIMISVMASIVGIIVAAAVVFLIIRFRERPGQEDELPNQIHGHTKAEVTWTILPAVLLAVVAIVSLPTIFELADRDDDAIEVFVEGQQWWWQYSYDLDGDGEYEIVTANDLVIPAGETVNLEITSNDVIHSFWVPQLNGKKDAVPGRTHQWKIQAHEPGEYWGTCTEFCGLSHADMRIRTFALEAAEWDAWVADQQVAGTEPGQSFLPGSVEESVRAGYEVFQAQCASCHVVNGVFEGAAENPIPLRSGLAPNLTHLMSRTSFAGAIFDLYNDDGSLNVADLTAWIRDAPSQKPLAPDEERGMISFADQLGDQELADVVAYLSTLGERTLVSD